MSCGNNCECRYTPVTYNMPMNLFRRRIPRGRGMPTGTPRHRRRSLMQKCLTRGSVHGPAETGVHAVLPSNMHMYISHTCTDALGARHKQMAQRPPVGHAAQSGQGRNHSLRWLLPARTPPSALRAPAAASAVRSHPSRAALCSATLRASIRVGSRERAGERTAAGTES